MKNIIFLVVFSLIGIIVHGVPISVTMLNGDSFPSRMQTEEIYMITEYGFLSIDSTIISEVKFPEPGKGDTRLSTIYGDLFSGFILNDFFDVVFYGSTMSLRRGKVRSITFNTPKKNIRDYDFRIILKNEDILYAYSSSDSINVQASYGLITVLFEDIESIRFEGFGNVLSEITMDDGGIIRGMIRDDYFKIRLSTDCNVNIAPDLMVSVEVSEESRFKKIPVETPEIQVEKVEEPTIEIHNELVLVKAGAFSMGNTRNDREGNANESPIHRVILSYDFLVSKYVVTLLEYDPFTKSIGREMISPGIIHRSAHPAVNVSWFDAIAYCNWLSKKEGIPPAFNSKGDLIDRYGHLTDDISQVVGYRLLTEAEWEYTARGGHLSRTDFKYAGSNDIDDVAWYTHNSSNRAQLVGQKAPNELGLYDMSGNVWEWCYDWFGVYIGGERLNPIGPHNGSTRVTRGGSWDSFARNCRVSQRGGGQPNLSTALIGFRIARTHIP